MDSLQKDSRQIQYRSIIRKSGGGCQGSDIDLIVLETGHVMLSTAAGGLELCQAKTYLKGYPALLGSIS